MITSVLSLTLIKWLHVQCRLRWVSDIGTMTCLCRLEFLWVNLIFFLPSSRRLHILRPLARLCCAPKTATAKMYQLDALAILNILVALQPAQPLRRFTRANASSFHVRKIASELRLQGIFVACVMITSVLSFTLIKWLHVQCRLRWVGDIGTMTCLCRLKFLWVNLIFFSSQFSMAPYFTSSCTVSVPCPENSVGISVYQYENYPYSGCFFSFNWRIILEFSKVVVACVFYVNCVMCTNPHIFLQRLRVQCWLPT